jgi:hypothetical protein
MWRHRPAVAPLVTTCYFERSDFEKLGSRLGVPVEITETHRLNSYFGFLFNAVYRRPA